MGSVRRTLTLGVGAAVGAAATWLLDPELGSARRRAAAKAAAAHVRDVGRHGVRHGFAAGRARLGRAGTELTDRAAQGFRVGRAERAETLAAGSDRSL